MLLQSSNDLHAVLWDSPLEVEQHVPALSGDNADFAKRALGKREGKGAEWYGLERRAAMRAVREGWSDGIERITALRCDVPPVESVRRRRVRADQGDALDMQAVLRGDLSRAWERTRRLSRPAARVVSIVCDVTASASTGAHELYWRGAAALRAVEVLEGAGYSVALYGAFGSRGALEGCRLAQVCEVKSSESPLDMSRLAGMLALSAWFRTALFAGCAVAAEQTGVALNWELGHADAATSREGALLLGLPPSMVLLPQTVLSQEAAEQWLLDALPELTAPGAVAA